MTTKVDDLEAVRVLVETLTPFSDEDRERIVRWAREKMGMAATPVTSPALPAVGSGPPEVQASRPPAVGGQDIATFVGQKDPTSDVHFAVTVAYFHQFLATGSERKDAITKEDILDACRKVNRKRPKHPAQVLVNAYRDGVLDRGERGQYRLNSVGENLVAMVLPGNLDAKVKAAKPKKSASTGARKRQSNKLPRSRAR